MKKKSCTGSDQPQLKSDLHILQISAACEVDVRGSKRLLMSSSLFLNWKPSTRSSRGWPKSSRRGSLTVRSQLFSLHSIECCANPPVITVSSRRGLTAVLWLVSMKKYWKINSTHLGHKQRNKVSSFGPVFYVCHVFSHCCRLACEGNKAPRFLRL